MRRLIRRWQAHRAQKHAGTLVDALAHRDRDGAYQALNRIHSIAGPGGVFAACWMVSALTAKMTGIDAPQRSGDPDAMVAMRIEAQTLDGVPVEDIDAEPALAPTIGAMRFLTACANDDGPTAAALFGAAHQAGRAPATLFVDALLTFCSDVICTAVHHTHDEDCSPD
jgi:hypothetical protein